ANCDLYIIVFDNTFTDIQHKWQNYIEQTLQRSCLLVRTKVDELFLNTFEEDIGEEFDSISDDKYRELYQEKIIRQIRSKVSHDIHGELLSSNVYLTFASYYINKRNKILAEKLFSKFDINKLIHYLSNLPLNLYEQRLHQMALCATARVINTCFRRGYVISILKYKIEAGILGIIPFADLFAGYLGREDIRQTFGINDRSRFSNWFNGKSDTFKNYLKEFDIDMDENGLKTSAFKKTFSTNSNIKDKGKNFTKIAGPGAVGAG
ncbi:unnamed protein product, partial [Didymodactylos carnosus]